jgi:pimeloyl-ACP methyl ester carboxylesterase
MLDESISLRYIWRIANAYAQTALAPAYPATPQFGPEKAIGAVIWTHGHSNEVEDSKSPTPPYVWNLHQGGWDTYRFNRMRDGDTLPASTHRLVEEVNKLKQDGYGKVALAGQSFGAFIALMVADETNKIDAVIATAPAAFGNFSEYYDSWRLNATRLYPLLENIQTAKVVLFFFMGTISIRAGAAMRQAMLLPAGECRLRFLISLAD